METARVISVNPARDAEGTLYPETTSRILGQFLRRSSSGRRVLDRDFHDRMRPVRRVMFERVMGVSAKGRCYAGGMLFLRIFASISGAGAVMLTSGGLSPLATTLLVAVVVMVSAGFLERGTSAMLGVWAALPAVTQFIGGNLVPAVALSSFMAAGMLGFVAFAGPGRYSLDTLTARLAGRIFSRSRRRRREASRRISYKAYSYTAG